MEQLLEKIKKHKTIIIHRHSNPDGDAMGSQLGLKEIIKENFPEKEVYAVGDTNKYRFMGLMDEIDDEKFNGALSIICDVAVCQMISDRRYILSNEIYVVDHHQNGMNLFCDGEDYQNEINSYIHPEYIACAEIIATFAKENGLKVSSKAATLLYGGIVTDSGRFQYGSNLSHVFSISSYLMDNGADAQFIYKNLYVESLDNRIMKNYFQNKMQLTTKNVAYMINDKDVYEKFDVDTFTVSRGMVNLMAGIEGVNIWANFTYDKATGKIFCEFRSRDIEIVDIAKKYGGGGHECACGATIESFDTAKLILNDFDKLMEEKFNV